METETEESIFQCTVLYLEIFSRVTQLSSVVNQRPATEENGNMNAKSGEKSQQKASIITKKGCHHVKKLVSKRRVRKRQWLKANTEVFYRNKVNI